MVTDSDTGPVLLDNRIPGGDHSFSTSVKSVKFIAKVVLET